MIIKIIQGIIIGSASVIPGLSGGALAVSMGVYEKLIHAVNIIFKSPLEAVKSIYQYVIGIMLGVGVSVVVLTYLFKIAPLYISMLFIGLMIGSLPVIIKKINIKKINIFDIIICLLFGAFIIFLPYLGIATVTEVIVNIKNIIILFVLGIVTALTIVIPGISGSMTLIVLGYYTYMLEMGSTVIKSLFILDFATIYGYIPILVPIALGIVFGVLVTARIMELLFRKAPNKVYSAIVGIIIATPIPIIMELGLFKKDIVTIFISILIFAIGMCITRFFIKEKEEESI